MAELKIVMKDPSVWTSVGFIAIAIFLLGNNEFFKNVGAVLLLFGSIFFIVRRFKKSR